MFISGVINKRASFVVLSFNMKSNGHGKDGLAPVLDRVVQHLSNALSKPMRMLKTAI